jgi:hypothetical protein
MKRNTLFAAVALFCVLLLSPIALADVYVPPGPYPTQDAWICPHLFAFDLQNFNRIGWMYSDGPMYYPVAGQFVNDWALAPQILKGYPNVVGPTDIPFGTEVMILGYIPMVAVSPDQVPPPVELKITWNGIPYVVTLKLPDDQIVGYDYPPKIYPDIATTYPFGWPQEAPYINASYNIWVGDIKDSPLGVLLPSSWYETLYGYVNGYWFTYVFHPNVGDWIAYDCTGETKFPPTYDITALFEYGTSQIWFPHVCFDVSLLETHKTILYSIPNVLTDTFLIKNVGKERACTLDWTQTFPYEGKRGSIPNYDSAMARIDGPLGQVQPWIKLKDLDPKFGTYWPFVFPAPFDHLDPGETMTITMGITIVMDGSSFTIVFDSMVSAKQIPPWKYPLAMHSITVGSPESLVPTYLWTGWELWYDGEQWRFTIVDKWPVPGTDGQILRDPISHPPPTMTLIGPVDLNGDRVIDMRDVALVRQAIIGLIPFDARMDINGNKKVDTQDLAAYKSVVKG